MSYGLTLTGAGQAAIASAIASGNRVNFIAVALADALPEVIPPAAIELPNEVWRGAPVTVMLGEDGASVVLRVVVPATDGGWRARSIALFGDAGVMLALAAFPSTYKPNGADGAAATWTLDLVLTIGAEGVPAVVVPDIVDWLADLIANSGGGGGGGTGGGGGGDGGVSVFAAKVRVGSVAIAPGEAHQKFPVMFAAPFDAGVTPAVSATCLLPAGGDFITVAAENVSDTGFTAVLSAYVEASGYQLQYLAIVP